MKSNVATFLSPSEASVSTQLVQWLKSATSLMLRPTLAILFWLATVGIGIATHVEYRGIIALLGCAGAAIIVRGEMIPGRGLPCATLVFIALPLVGSFEEVLHNPGYRLETIIDLGLLTSSERFNHWHAVALLISFLMFLFWRPHQKSRPWPERYTWVAGAFFTDTRTVMNVLRRVTHQQHDPGLDFGSLILPSSWGTKNFLLTGVIESGKTTFLKKLMASALRSLRSGVDQRALIYDLKAEFYPFLLALGLSVQIRIINPFDRRCAWWDLAAEITDAKTARQIAEALVPHADPKNSTRGSHFFVGRARGIVAGLMINFQRHSPGRWTFADVMLALRDRARYETILRRDTDTAGLVDSLEHGDTRGDVLATMDDYRWKYEVVAALWDHAQKNGNPNFTIKDWIQESEILLLTQDKNGGEILNPIYQALLRCLTEKIASQPDSNTRRTWFFLDEFPTLGKVPLGGGEQLNTCRTKGAATVITFQDIEQLREVYGDHEANTIVGALKCKAIFKSAPENAKWAQDVFGKAEYFVERTNSSFTFTHGAQKSSSFTTSTASSREQVPLFRSEYFTYLPSPTPADGFQSAVFLDGYAFAAKENFHQTINSIPRPLDEAGYLPAPPDWQELADWTADDLRRLHLQDLLGPEPAAASPAPRPPQTQAELPGLANGAKATKAKGKNGEPVIKIKR